MVFLKKDEDFPWRLLEEKSKIETFRNPNPTMLQDSPSGLPALVLAAANLELQVADWDNGTAVAATVDD